MTPSHLLAFWQSEASADRPSDGVRRCRVSFSRFAWALLVVAGLAGHPGLATPVAAQEPPPSPEAADPQAAPGSRPKESSEAFVRRGKALYAKLCARCHGADGKGKPDQDVAPLDGEITFGELLETIVETMPEDNPDACRGEAARAVATFVMKRFYRERQPAGDGRIVWSRLTGRQYRQVLADMGAIFLGASRDVVPGGLRGEYFDGPRFARKKRRGVREDAHVDFDFGTKSPMPGKIGPASFAIRWTGSLLAPATGWYEIVVRSKNGYRLWLNDPDHALIDAWVRSGDENERRARVFLIEGRAYPIRLEMFKFQKKKFQEDQAAITLRWKPPGRTERVVPARWLSPKASPPVLVVSTPFPPDDRSYGYERAPRIEPEWFRAATLAATEVAERIVTWSDRFVGSSKADRKARRRFFERWVEAAFRRPLDPATRKAYIEPLLDEEVLPADQIRRLVLATLLSPRFLDRETGRDGWDAFDVASRLSFTLWDSMPPPWLFEAAAAGRLADDAGIRRAAERLAKDRRAWFKLRRFFHFWLGLDRATELAKDAKRFPEFDELLVDDLRASLDRFLERVIWQESGDYRKLLTSDRWFASRAMLAFYGGKASGTFDADGFTWQQVPRPEHAAGVLTHPLFLAAKAYPDTSSPIHRGVFIARAVLGRRLKPPPVAVAPLAADLKPEWTTRERVAFQTRPKACASCHDLINPLGFLLESYDAAGRFRTKENGRPVDTRGWYDPVGGKRVQLGGPRALARYAAASPETRRAMVHKLFHETVKQPLVAFGDQAGARLEKVLADAGGDLRKLLVEIAVLAARPGKGEEPR